MQQAICYWQKKELSAIHSSILNESLLVTILSWSILLDCITKEWISNSLVGQIARFDILANSWSDPDKDNMLKVIIYYSNMLRLSSKYPRLV